MYRQIAACNSQRTVSGQHVVFNDATIIIARLTLRAADREHTTAIKLNVCSRFCLQCPHRLAVSVCSEGGIAGDVQTTCCAKHIIICHLQCAAAHQRITGVVITTVGQCDNLPRSVYRQIPCSR